MRSEDLDKKKDKYKNKKHKTNLEKNYFITESNIPVDMTEKKESPDDKMNKIFTKYSDIKNRLDILWNRV